MIKPTPGCLVVVLIGIAAPFVAEANYIGKCPFFKLILLPTCLKYRHVVAATIFFALMLKNSEALT